MIQSRPSVDKGPHRFNPRQYVAYRCSVCGVDSINRHDLARTKYRECVDCFDPVLCYGADQ